jgi:hypothetical protein
MATLLELPFCNKDPGKKLGFAMWPLGRLAGAGCRNPASSPRFLAGGGQGDGLGGTRVWFVGLDGVGAAPVSGHAGSQGCRPPRLANVRRARLGGEEGRGDEHPHVPRRVLGGLVGGERR